LRAHDLWFLGTRWPLHRGGDRVLDHRTKHDRQPDDHGRRTQAVERIRGLGPDVGIGVMDGTQQRFHRCGVAKGA
jgi:hypothetical protein